MKTADADGSGSIDYSEFITMSMDRQKLLTKANLQAAFDAFDADGNGRISCEEVRSLLGRFNSGATVHPEAYEEIIREVDTDGNGEIDIHEFKSMMLTLF
jgi:calcium-dependent protein kinase